jgi:RHS repeat-associated protein
LKELFTNRPEQQTFSILSPTSNQVTQTTIAGGAGFYRLFTYRTGGDLLQDQHRGGPIYDYSYDTANRLKSVKADGATTGQYLYDIFGRRVWSRASGVSVYYVYDQEGRLLAEHNGAGEVLKEYIWLDALLLAMIDNSSGQTYAIHAGELNEPLVMTTIDQSTAWDAWFEPFGETGTFSPPSATIALRFPGQWLQPGSPGLYQNWHRDYDPSLARYVEPDPVGHAGGQNLYVYVDGRPTSLIDPNGLFAPAVVPIIVAVRLAPVVIPMVIRLAVMTGLIETMASMGPSDELKKSKCPDHCEDDFERERKRCLSLYFYRRDAFGRCMERAAYNLDLCNRGLPPLPMWRDIHEDGWEASPPPRPIN